MPETLKAYDHKALKTLPSQLRKVIDLLATILDETEIFQFSHGSIKQSSTLSLAFDQSNHRTLLSLYASLYEESMDTCIVKTLTTSVPHRHLRHPLRLQTPQSPRTQTTDPQD